VPHVIFILFFWTKNWHWGAKTATVAKLRGGFVVFFLKGPKLQLRKSYGAKTAIKPIINNHIILVLGYDSKNGMNYQIIIIKSVKDRTS